MLTLRSLGRAWLRGWRFYPYSMLTVVFFGAWLLPFCARSHSEWEAVYVQTAEHLLAGEDIYLQPHGYLYPPFMSTLAVPFTFLPQDVGRVVWYLLNVACFVVMIRAAWFLTGGGDLEGTAKRNWKEQAIFLLGLGTGVWYCFHAITHQQTDLLIGALAFGGCWAWVRGKPNSAAVLIGLSAAMKCTPLLFAPYMLWRGQWKAALLLVAVAVGVNLLPDLIHSPAEGGTWLGKWAELFLAPMSGAEHVPGTWGSDVIYNQSISGLWNRWMITDWHLTADGVTILPAATIPAASTVKNLAYGSMLLLGLAMWAVMARPGSVSPQRRAGECGIVLGLMVLFSPMSSIPHFFVLLVGGLWLARWAVLHKDLVPRICLAAAILFAAMSNKDLWGADLYTLGLWYGAMTWNTIAVLLGCAYVLARCPRTSPVTS